MKSLTHGEISIAQVARIIVKEIQDNPDNVYRLVIGTDSQNFDITKVVSVIAFINEGHGGKFFYDVERIRPIRQLRPKLIYETSRSLQYMDMLIAEFEKLYDELGFDYTNIEISIHIDAGLNGPTSQLIAEISGWVKSLGYECAFKPDSPIASCVADRISK